MSWWNRFNRQLNSKNQRRLLRATTYTLGMLRSRMIVAAVVVVGVTVAIFTLPAPRAAAELEPIRYGKDVRPILSDRCFQCHGPDGEQRQANLRLDLAEEATKSRPKGAAIVPGNAAASPLFKRITSDDPKFSMPPPDSNKHALDAGQREIIRRWIDDGAHYESHWAFSPPTRAAVPTPKDAHWGSNEIDRFLLARMERAGVAASAPADHATLVRRLFLDLTGLPPTPQEIADFVGDTAPDARAKLIDRLMSQEPFVSRYAERMTVPWLDVARYADTSGIHMDAGRSIWLWRDWVIDAYRTNKPYDQFIVEQLAGDLMKDATPSQVIASGFNRNHVTSDEGGAIDEEYRLEYAVDRVATTSAAFMGLSVQCARCHDHKFDPVTTEDFYAMIAFFNSNEEPGIYTQSTDPLRSLEPALDMPTAAQTAQLAEIQRSLVALTAERDTPSPQEASEFDAYRTNLSAGTDLQWMPATTIAARSTHGSVLTIQPDGSVLVSGENPKNDEHIITLETDATDLRVVALEVLTDPSLPRGRAGRAPNGNATLDSIEIEAISKADPTKTERIKLDWAWADLEQPDGDYRVTNALTNHDDRVWAIDAHQKDGNRIAVFASTKSFGFAGGTQLRVTLGYISPYDQHALGRVRLSLATATDSLMERLPATSSAWYIAGPWMTEPGQNPYEIVRGPEASPVFNRQEKWGDFSWRYAPGVIDEQLVSLAQGTDSEYVARQIYSPTARELEISFGSDDGMVIYVNGVKVHEARVERSLSADQERVKIPLNAGENIMVCKIVNTGGPAGFYQRVIPAPHTMARGTIPLVLPESYTREEVRTAARDAWRKDGSPRVRELSEKIAQTEKSKALVSEQIPRTMVMKEAAMPRKTFVLKRGSYDQPDQDRPVTRAIPKFLGTLSDEMPANRLGLAQWLVSPQNPLTARVTINRLWEQFFGRGIVRTENDFGFQGEWPTHPELLDWLATEFRESGWDIQHMIRLMLNSDAYAQSSRVRPDIAEFDPDDRLLSWYPRQRLSAEQIRDQALYVSGLLRERVGGPSVKSYQPDGLWQEVAMPTSNTRTYQRGKDDDLWRRSLYTYWKRAAPPPSLLTFDAPTREYCVTRRMTTNTPLQALVLWNDGQFVEAARNMAARILQGSSTDSQRLTDLFESCTGQRPSATTIQHLLTTLQANRARYENNTEDAKKFISIGDSPQNDQLDSRELAAWTLLTNAIFSSDATLVKD